ncbi:MAG: bacteriohemerythrin [Gammaproteobacteria bacterium]|nr:bacteriohemerythrin [Gammaproteobacteria bacterium]
MSSPRRPLIEWRAEYSVGVPAVDAEHRELIELINELHAGLEGEDARMSTADFLGEIHARIAAHFALEEKIMREHNYDQLADHKADHERLLDEIRDLMDAYEDGHYVDFERLSRDLDRWFTEHFKTKDARLHRRLG